MQSIMFIILRILQVSAYKSSLSLLNAADARDAVAGMMAAKAYQAGVIRELLFAQRATANLVQPFADLTNTLANSAANNGVVSGTQAVLVPTDSSGAILSRPGILIHDPYDTLVPFLWPMPWLLFSP